MAGRSSDLLALKYFTSLHYIVSLSTMTVTKFRAYAMAALFLVIAVPLTLLHLANGFVRVLSSSQILKEDGNTDVFHPIGNDTLGVSNYSTI